MRASLSQVSTVSASASRALPDWQCREEPFTGAGLMVRIRFRAQCEFCCERGAGLMVRIRFPPAESQRTFGSSRRAGFASGRTRTIERDTKGAKTRFIAPAYGKFESSSLHRRVSELSVPERRSCIMPAR